MVKGTVRCNLPLMESSTLYCPFAQPSGLLRLKIVSVGPAVVISWLYSLSVSPEGASHLADNEYFAAVPWVLIAMKTPSLGLK